MVCRALLDLECICRTSPFLLASEFKARQGLGNDGTCFFNGSRAVGVGVLRDVPQRLHGFSVVSRASA